MIRLISILAVLIATPAWAYDLSYVTSVLQAQCPSIVGLSIPNSANTATWVIWKNGSSASLASADSCAGPAIVGSAVQAAVNAASIPTSLQIISTSTPALSGIYAIDTTMQQRMAAVSIYIQVNGKFPAGQSQLAWPDASGVPHAFTTTASFQTFASAVADFVAAIDLGQTPSQPVTIP